ncbi:hypothetical protein TgHK011_008594 [Trichoderma gracile]|nr:hypothetical protein TgHK011_008594 [Trichoderma gracile]
MELSKSRDTADGPRPHSSNKAPKAPKAQPFREIDRENLEAAATHSHELLQPLDPRRSVEPLSVFAAARDVPPVRRLNQAKARSASSSSLTIIGISMPSSPTTLPVPSFPMPATNIPQLPSVTPQTPAWPRRKGGATPVAQP